MLEDDRIWQVRDLLKEYVASPSVRHIRDPASLISIARRIVKRLDRSSGIWQKWEGEREVLARSAAGCWIPAEIMRDYLNLMPGTKLTTTDVSQRMKAIEEESYSTYPNEELKDGCEAIFREEQDQGTELSATIGRIAEFISEGERRLDAERRDRYKKSQADAQAVSEARLLSGADCKWTRLQGAPHWYSRTNGRTYRLSPTADKRWELLRIDMPSPDVKGDLIGRYAGKSDATKVVAEISFKPEFRR